MLVLGHVWRSHDWQVFRATVEASFFWCAGSSNLTVEQLQRLKGAQSRLLRKMLRLKRDSGESRTDLIIRAKTRSKQTLETPTTGMNGGMRDVFSYGWSGVDILRASADWIRQGLRFEFLSHWSYNAIIHVADQHDGRQTSRRVHPYMEVGIVYA